MVKDDPKELKKGERKKDSKKRKKEEGFGGDDPGW
jgi:hypothetical protein